MLTNPFDFLVSFFRTVVFWSVVELYDQFRRRHQAISFVLECLVLFLLSCFVMSLVGSFLHW